MSGQAEAPRVVIDVRGLEELRGERAEVVKRLTDQLRDAFDNVARAELEALNEQVALVREAAVALGDRVRLEEVVLAGGYRGVQLHVVDEVRLSSPVRLAGDAQGLPR